MIKAVLADIPLMNPARHITLEEPLPEVFVPSLNGATQVYRLAGRAVEDGDFLLEDLLTIPNVKAGEYVYCFARFE